MERSNSPNHHPKGAGNQPHFEIKQAILAQEEGCKDGKVIS